MLDSRTIEGGARISRPGAKIIKQNAMGNCLIPPCSKV
ncbi:unnamed protein product [Linum tenue]|uniref:Uncharacterized protein n=1 Tax=Linum tenue TaxID=586396 RepID=A0AAV0Q406_9ROSI|nr:unnamed protein product [Linum tenue]